jgi:cyclohexanone monooxygenase
LRERYRRERDKRLRPDGNDQYREVAGEFAHYVVDPYVDPIVRDPVSDEVDVVVIEGGFGGLLAGARLREAGVRALRIIEKGGDFQSGGHWRADGRMPGLVLTP